MSDERVPSLLREIDRLRLQAQNALAENSALHDICNAREHELAVLRNAARNVAAQADEVIRNQVTRYSRGVLEGLRRADAEIAAVAKVRREPEYGLLLAALSTRLALVRTEVHDILKGLQGRQP